MKIALNRISGEKLTGLVVKIVGDRNNSQDNPCSSAIQTLIEMKGYFLTQFDLQETLQKMQENGQTEFIASPTFPGGGYRLK